MSYLQNLQQVLDFIEENLEEDINIQQVADVAGYSAPHFYRVFSAVTGYNIGEYIRLRKLSCALWHIIHTKSNILHTALQYGYETHESFTRAIKSTFGESPSYFKREYEIPKYVDKINLNLENKYKDVKLLKPEIIIKKGLSLVGIIKEINQADNVKNNLIPLFQKDFKEILNKNKININHLYSVYTYNPKDIVKNDEDINYTYFCGIEETNLLQPINEIKSLLIPENKYAHFVYDCQNQTLNGDKIDCSIYDYIDGIWLPNSGFELSDDIDYEVFNIDKRLIEIYISIK